MPPADALLLPGIAVPEDADARDDRLTRELVEFCSRFNVPAVLPDTIEAGDAWGANCGPMALAAVLGLPTVEAARPLVRPFRGFMSPTDMLNALAAAARAGLVQSFRHVRSPAPDPWPMLGIVRIQWFGPWMDLANQRAAYRYTHFVGARDVLGAVEIYDATPNRWLPLDRWARWCPTLWPKRATGWAPVTCIDVAPET